MVFKNERVNLHENKKVCNEKQLLSGAVTLKSHENYNSIISLLPASYHNGYGTYQHGQPYQPTSFCQYKTGENQKKFQVLPRGTPSRLTR